MANKTTKLFAILALFGIIISVVGTALLIFFGDDNTTQEKVYNTETTKTITQEDINKIIENSEVKVTATGATK